MEKTERRPIVFTSNGDGRWYCQPWLDATLHADGIAHEHEPVPGYSEHLIVANDALPMMVRKFKRPVTLKPVRCIACQNA